MTDRQVSHERNREPRADTIRRQLLIAFMLLAAFPAFVTSQSSVLSSTFWAGDLRLDTNPDSEAWANAPRVTADRDYFGNPIPGPPTEVRSRWTKEHLYLLYMIVALILLLLVSRWTS